ncbi:MAG TPA: hypothetical protein VM265_07160 [Sphingomicrobium sp.]|nr:hypothetical protein [Sphingomicrobium sp.]
MEDVLERSPETKLETSSEPGHGYGVISKALMGAAAGAVGTWALDRADWRMWNNEGEDARLQTDAVRPFGEPPAHVLASKAQRASGIESTPEQHELAGVAVHYGIGIAPAVAYAVVRDKLPGRGPARGLLYGLGLFLLQDETANAVTGLGAKPNRYPWQAHARGLISHLVYGVVTEMVLNGMDRSLRSRRDGAETHGEPQGRPRAVRR